MSAKRPNVVWIFPDEWRHDALGYAGNPVVQTPALDSLAARGLPFRNVYCESPVCQPARASLLTCRFPSQHGKRQNGLGRDPGDESGVFPAPESDNILHRLRAAGYRTAEVGKMHFDWAPYQFPAEHGADGGVSLARFGFDEVAEEYDKHVLMADGVETPYVDYLRSRGLLEQWRDHERTQTEIMFGRDPAGRAALADALSPEDTLDAFIGREACSAIERLAGGADPFFLWVGFVGPHPPFDGPRELSDRYDPEQIPLGPVEPQAFPPNRYGDFIRWCITFLNSAHYGEADFREMGKHYYGAITLIDEQVARIVETLERAGIAEDTWIVFSSDHGELLGDHGLVTKANFYEASVRVPALLVPPRGRARPAAALDALAQGIDVPATILELAGADRSGLAGRSLLGDPARTAVLSEIGAFSMALAGGLKLVVETASLEPQMLHDLRSDPDERVDLLGDPTYGQPVAELLDLFPQPR